MSENKYGHRPVNWFVSIVDKLGGEGSADAFLRGDLVVSQPARRWRVDENGWIRFTLTSTGETGAEWADWLRANKYALGSEAEYMLRSASFQPSQAGLVYEIAVLPGALWQDRERITQNIRAYCDNHSLKHGKEMNPEVVCLIRRTFSNEEIEAMGLTWIIGLHESINVSDGYPGLLGADRDYGLRRLGAYYFKPDGGWFSAYGFAAVVSQSSPQVSGS